MYWSAWRSDRCRVQNLLEAIHKFSPLEAFVKARPRSIERYGTANLGLFTERPHRSVPQFAQDTLTSHDVDYHLVEGILRYVYWSCMGMDGYDRPFALFLCVTNHNNCHPQLAANL